MDEYIIFPATKYIAQVGRLYQTGEPMNLWVGKYVYPPDAIKRASFIIDLEEYERHVKIKAESFEQLDLEAIKALYF